jgi:hypothetical protein
MIVSVHQPQYLAWPGYFHKILKSDAFVFLDNVQYKEREYQNRNQIRTKNGAQWLSVPVLNSKERFIKIKEVCIDNSQDWPTKHWKAIYLNYNRSPFFKEYADFFYDLYKQKWVKLLDLNIYMIKGINKILNIDKIIYLESDLKIENTRTERIIDICKKLNAHTYLSGVGAKAYLKEELFTAAGLELRYQQFRCPKYSQCYGPFIPNLSMIDFLFNCGLKTASMLGAG